MKNVNRIAILIFALLGAASVAAAPDVQLNAILGKKVIVTIDGEQYTVAEGEPVSQGVVFIETHNKLAVFEWEGQRFELAPSSRISTQFEAKKTEAITIRRDANMHYFVTGAINGGSTHFLVDTGATLVSLSGEHASRLGLKWQNNPSYTVGTAGGTTKAYSLMLNKLTINGIDVYNVEAAVTPRQTIPALLGMSYLQHFEMSESGNVLTLKKKY